MPNRKYYTTDAFVRWLKVPTFLKQDILAISSTGNYVNNYNDYGYFSEIVDEYEGTNGSNHYLRTHQVDSTISKNSGASNKDDIMFEYTEGVGGLAMRLICIKVFSLEILHIDSITE